MMPLDQLECEALETSTLTDRELLVGIHRSVREINGTVKSHSLQLRYLWALATFMCSGMLAVIGLLVAHVVP